ncbi:MAG TPA: hypothetical protein VKA23_03550, partial [Mariprofundaceae bacterium]|nr:hypothetical protein [Mariprofundaceae bacterium]
HRVVRMASKAERVIQEIFTAYMDKPEMLPPDHAGKLEKGTPVEKRARVIADYIAGMTDRFALDEYDRLFDVHARS